MARTSLANLNPPYAPGQSGNPEGRTRVLFTKEVQDAYLLTTNAETREKIVAAALTRVETGDRTPLDLLLRAERQHQRELASKKIHVDVTYGQELFGAWVADAEYTLKRRAEFLEEQRVALTARIAELDARIAEGAARLLPAAAEGDKNNE
jgi:hypothetical protein